MTTDFLKLAGKNAIIVGGGFGMGRAISSLLGQAGANIGVLDFNAEQGNETVLAIEKLGVRAVNVECDALNVKSLQTAIGAAASELKGADILITVVGQAGWDDVFGLTPEQWDRDHNKNLRYVFFAVQAFARLAEKGEVPRAITSIASVAGVQSSPYSAAYGAAKAGLCNLVRSLAVELAPYQVRMNAVAPGVIETPRTAASRDYAAFRQKVANSAIPFKRPGEVKDIANAVLFLSSDLASYVTGQTLCVDGGWTAANLASEALGLKDNVPKRPAGKDNA
jgi:NAD(P)-dependent dehydrogenase (short-subunit alcohol dehydrogenase family)